MAYGAAAAARRRAGGQHGMSTAVVWARGGGSSREESSETKEEEKTAARVRDIYDMWAPCFSLTPVKPMPRFGTLVDYISSVHLRLQQKLI